MTYTQSVQQPRAQRRVVRSLIKQSAVRVLSIEQFPQPSSSTSVSVQEQIGGKGQAEGSDKARANSLPTCQQSSILSRWNAYSSHVISQYWKSSKDKSKTADKCPSRFASDKQMAVLHYKQDNS